MLVELLLLSGLGASAAGIAYLHHHSVEEKKASEKRRRDEETQFRVSVLNELRKPRSTFFRLSDFAARCEIPEDSADRVAEDLYISLYRKTLADGVITGKEQGGLDRLTAALELDAVRVGRIEKKVKDEKYEAAVSSVLSDGEITPDEAVQLAQLRRQMGMSNEDAFQLTKDISRSAYLTTFRRIARDGTVTRREQEELLRCKQALAVSDDQAARIIREEALTLYKERFANVIQDGIVTPEEEKGLAWLQEWAGLHDSDVLPYYVRMKRVNQLAAYRQGNLLSVKTRRILEGGETCHWDDSCTLLYETRTRTLSVSGELVVTSKNIYFISAAKSLSYRPSRILDIIRYSNALEIKVNARQGSGRYFVSEAEELEAILVGVVAKHKFLLSESYSSSKTRHIPDDVKREVWDRDGGRCVRCSASEYLEFDHIIPHTRGGANSVNNVQLLCRKCNLLKSDRI